MEEIKTLKSRLFASAGMKKAQLVLKSAQVLNVFTDELETADVAICDGYITGVGSYEGEQEVELPGMVICPGFIDGHIHLESSMVAPGEFERLALAHGTTGVVTDPHEIANVAGTEGIDYILETTEGLLMDVYVMLPSCVPATGLDESGGELGAEDLAPYYARERVLGLAELMDFHGAASGEDAILAKVCGAKKHGKLIDGHGPGVTGRQLNAYVFAGAMSDHECSHAEEGLEKLRRGQWIMIREGTAAKNLEALMPLCKEPYYHRCMFVTDDKHPEDLLANGHIDGIIRKAIRLGADPIKAIKMGSLHPAQYFGLKNTGAVAPGYRADLVVLSDLKQMKVHQVYKDGRLAAEDGKVITRAETAEGSKMPEAAKAYPRVYHSFHMQKVEAGDFQLQKKGDYIRVIRLTPGQLLTEEEILPFKELSGYGAGVDLGADIIKIAVVERHRGTGHMGIGYLKGYGLKAGAVASSVSHDSHNLIVVGVNDADMALAANQVRDGEGGLAVVQDGAVLGSLPLPIGGLMTHEPAEAVREKLARLKALTRSLGVWKCIDPFMTLAFASLPVIPKLRLNTLGLIDVEQGNIVPLFPSGECT